MTGTNPLQVHSAAHGTLNRQAKAQAKSAYQGMLQRFFNQLITSMQTPAVIASIARDLAAGHASVVQIVSTGEAMQERRLAEIPADEWHDVSVDITPRDYVLCGDPDKTYSLQSGFMSSGSRAGADFRDENIDFTPDN